MYNKGFSKGIDVISDALLKSLDRRSEKSFPKKAEVEKISFSSLEDIKKKNYKSLGTGLYKDAQHHLWQVEKNGEDYVLMRAMDENGESLAEIDKQVETEIDKVFEVKDASKKVAKERNLYTVEEGEVEEITVNDINKIHSEIDKADEAGTLGGCYERVIVYAWDENDAIRIARLYDEAIIDYANVLINGKVYDLLKDFNEDNASKKASELWKKLDKQKGNPPKDFQIDKKNGNPPKDFKFADNTKIAFGNEVNYEKTGRGVTFKLDPDTEEARAELKERFEELGEIAILPEIFESLTSNGWMRVDPETIGALTSAPMISDNSFGDTDDYEFAEANIYWYPDYAVRSTVQELIDTGKTYWDLAKKKTTSNYEDYNQ